MVNQLGKFTPRIADLSSPLCEFEVPRMYGDETKNDESFEAIKQELSRPPFTI